MGRKKQHWGIGDIFWIKQSDGKFCIGQILDLMMRNVVSCAFYDIRFDVLPKIENVKLDNEKLISLASVSREQLDYHVWGVFGTQAIQVERSSWPNEIFRINNWVGAKIYDAAIIEDFLNAFYALAPWDDWFDPNYLDNLLVRIDIKPSKLIYKKDITI